MEMFLLCACATDTAFVFVEEFLVISVQSTLMV